MNKYGIIYLIKNKINKKCYIGQTVQSFDNRYGRNLLKFTHNEHLRNSIIKYGIENFEIDKEFDVAFTKDELDKLECMYIRIYKTTNPKFGYNKMYGGSNGLHTDDTKLKMRESQKNANGVKVACFTNGRIFDTIADACREYSITQSEIIACCQNRIRKAGSENGMPLQWMYYKNFVVGGKPLELDRLVCVNTGEIFCTYDDAVLKYPTTSVSGISQCCSFEYNSCGYDNDGNRLQWMKYSDYKKGVKLSKVKDNRIICITSNKIFDNATKASEYYNLDISHILNNCKFKSNYCGELEDGTRLQWLYYSDFKKGIKQCKVKDERVVCVNSGLIFKNAKEASNFYDLDRSCISKCCRGVRKSCGKDNDGSPIKWMKYSEYINSNKKAV